MTKERADSLRELAESCNKNMMDALELALNENRTEAMERLEWVQTFLDMFKARAVPGSISLETEPSATDEVQ